jgi:acetyl-CoA synthetase
MPETTLTDPVWATVARRLIWTREPDDVYVGDSPRGRWFPGGALNVAVNCLDRHLVDRRDAVAVHWEGEPEDRRSITYGELHADVCRFAAVLQSLGVGPGDRVVLQMGLIPEAVVAMLACARIGAMHAVMPSVLPPDELAARIADVAAKVVITQDGAWRHGVILPLKARVDEAVAAGRGVEHTIVVRRTGMDIAWYEGDRWYHELMELVEPRAEPARSFPAEHPLLIVHLANRRGRPNAIVHGSGNFLAYLVAFHGALVERRDHTFWFPSEVGWLACQSHGIYGPLACGGTTVLFEGMLDTPSHDRVWQIVARYGVEVLAATPSLIRHLRAWKDSPPRRQELASLELFMSAGEAIDDELAAWLRREVALGGARMVDAWGQTELGGLVAFNGGDRVAPDPGLDVVDGEGDSLPVGEEGELVLRRHWPGMCIARGGGDDAPARAFGRFPGLYATGDRAVRRLDGAFEFLGRIDPIITVSGQLVSVTEVEDALLEHPYVSRAVVSESPDPRTNRAVVALVAPVDAAVDRDELAGELRSYIAGSLGGLSRPRTIVFAESLPQSVSRQAVRRALGAMCTARPVAGLLSTTAAELAALVNAADS